MELYPVAHKKLLNLCIVCSRKVPLMNRKPRIVEAEEIIDDFMALVEQHEEGCWLWLGKTYGRGYGRFNVPGKLSLRPAHWVSHEMFNGPRKGLHVMHTCDNPACVNPNHLTLGTHQDNMRDKTEKGRVPHGENHPQATITDAQALEIFNDKRHPPVIANEYGINKATVYNIQAKRSWKHIHK